MLKIVSVEGSTYIVSNRATMLDRDVPLKGTLGNTWVQKAYTVATDLDHPGQVIFRVTNIAFENYVRGTKRGYRTELRLHNDNYENLDIWDVQNEVNLFPAIGAHALIHGGLCDSHKEYLADRDRNYASWCYLCGYDEDGYFLDSDEVDEMRVILHIVTDSGLRATVFGEKYRNLDIQPKPGPPAQL